MTIVKECSKCDAYCCRHVAVYIDTPQTANDFDTIRYYLMHENIWVSIDHDGEWLVEMRTPCRNIGKDYMCKIYKDRPGICRDYPGDGELCERQTEEHSYSQLFTNVEEFETYLSENKGLIEKKRRMKKA